tara:strand:+ start:1180 stop:1680 length:501 start_codon:yes stop_codon:yes gene_type:complete
MANINLTTHFTLTLTDSDDSRVITGGSTTAADTIAVTHYYDQRFTVGATTLQELWSDSNALGNFDFLWIETDGDLVEVQLLCNENGVIGDSELENAFCVKLTSGIPFILSNDDSRNRGDMAGTVNASNYAAEVDTWETNWAADTIDRIECYNGHSGSVNIRIFAAT